MTLTVTYPDPQVAVLTVTEKVFGVFPFVLEFGQKVQELLREKQVRHFAFDLQHVDWINSVGYGNLVSLCRVIREADCTLVLLCISKKVEDGLQMTRLDTVLQSYPTLDMYLEALHTQPAR